MNKIIFQTTTRKINKETGLSSSLLVIMLNVNGLNSLVRRYRLAKWIINQNPTICYL